MTVSAVIITKNEENNILECIKTLKFVDEIIVIDNFSQDKTVEKAITVGAKVYTHSGLDFSYLRNIGKEKSTSEWLLYVDADERVSKDLEEEIENIVKHDTGFSAYQIVRQNYYFGRLWPKNEKMTRMMRKDSLLGWQGILHESPIVSGKVGQLKSRLIHYTHRNLSEMVAKTNEWSEVEAQLRYKNNHPNITWWRLLRMMLTSFFDSYVEKEAWKAGSEGIIESIYQSFSMFITYAKLWEKQNTYLRKKRNG
ncbi:hypothetical protein COV53_04185 [Candidatus Gottesmanbacteria bacterium CG11_big_fil_rev_8_21_14_0_20_37_11]|uniref:Glycosyltransferase 2-like domain-containing protein n=1 Tax=Candidatus Gottesmanbacteria bacterium CG11_big_fil_rev_8_21_14_0_20_37_11 TaxID=1974575 RepID=A0A2H0NH38_9BACT|nr:MAG: hypothetical protein COV53_04185 [Candidatus Gottesmanbacteria bacterium CG11_big_fil_rev_8_21_14_0_20_37_11]